MPFDGSGTFARLYDWEQDATDGIDINATRMDAEFDGIATALTLCFLRDGSVGLTGNLNLNNHSLTNIADGSAGTPSLKFNSTAGIYYSSGLGFSVGGAAVATLDSASFDSASMVRAKGLTLPATGAGVELGYSGTTGYVGVIDRATSAYKTLNLRGSTVQVAPSGTTVLSIDSSGAIFNPGGSTVMSVTSLGVGITGILAVGGSSVVTVGSTNALPYAGLSNMVGAGFLGAAGAAAVSRLTGTQATALLDLATASLKGLAPAFPNDNTKFLRGDGTYAAPVGASWQTIATLTPTGTGTTAVVNVSSYSDIFVQISGASHNSGSSQSLAMYKTGSGTALATIPGGAITAAASLSGAMWFALKGTVAFGAMTDGTTLANFWAPVLDNTIFFAFTAGSFDAGTITVYGRT